MIIETMDYVVRFVPMPPTVHGAIRMDDEARANIYLNENDSLDRQREAFRHEIRHLVRNDIFNEIPIRVVEGA